MKIRTNDGVRGTNRNRAVRLTLDTGCPAAAGASCSVASICTGPSFAPLPAKTVNDAGNPKSSAAPVLVHARGCALIERPVPDDAINRMDSTRSRASVSTMTSTAVAGTVHETSALVVTNNAAQAHRLPTLRTLQRLPPRSSRGSHPRGGAQLFDARFFAGLLAWGRSAASSSIDTSTTSLAPVATTSCDSSGETLSARG